MLTYIVLDPSSVLYHTRRPQNDELLLLIVPVLAMHSPHTDFVHMWEEFLLSHARGKTSLGPVSYDRGRETRLARNEVTYPGSITVQTLPGDQNTIEG